MLLQCCWIFPIQQQQSGTLLPPEAILHLHPLLSLSLLWTYLVSWWSISQLLFLYLHLGVLQGVVAKGRRSWCSYRVPYFFHLARLHSTSSFFFDFPNECLASCGTRDRLVHVLTRSRSGVRSYRSLPLSQPSRYFVNSISLPNRSTFYGWFSFSICVCVFIDAG